MPELKGPGTAAKVPASAGLAAGGALWRLSRLRSWSRPVSHTPARRATNATARKQLFWIKQHLRIKAFFGTSENAVKTQIWIAISVYVLVAIIKKRLELPRTLYETLQILSLTLFERTPLDQLLTQHVVALEPISVHNQMNLFE